MPDDIATTAAEYGNIVLGHYQNAFNAMLPATFAALRTNRLVFQPVVALQPNQANGLLTLARTIHNNGVAAGQADRVANMVFLNEVLGANLLALPNQVTHVGVQELRAAYAVMYAPLQPHLRTFYRARVAATKLRDLIALCAPVATVNFVAGRVDLLTTICTVTREVTALVPAYAGTFDGLAVPAMGFLNRMRGQYPPDAGFAGFAQWGEGNHSSVAANQKWHFLKHVCMIDDGEGGLNAEGADALIVSVLSGNGMGMAQAAAMLESFADDDGPAVAEECGEWWRALNIRLPLATCEALIHDRVELDRIRPWFNGPNLSHAWVPEFVRSGVLSRCPQVLGYLMTNYQAAYCAYAINHSRNADCAFVSSNGAKVFIALSKDDTFTIGRYDSAGQMCISSCYKPTDLADKLRGARDGLMWRLIQD